MEPRNLGKQVLWSYGSRASHDSIESEEQVSVTDSNGGISQLSASRVVNFREFESSLIAKLSGRFIHHFHLIFFSSSIVFLSHFIHHGSFPRGQISSSLNKKRNTIFN